MNKNNDSKLTLLTSIVLGSLVVFLMFLCHKLILCIARVFVYLTGLATMLLVTVFYIFIIVFLISRFKKYYCKYYNNEKYKRNYFANIQIINSIIKIEKSLIFALLFILMMLYILNIFIKLF
ncbi:hypothetical protein [Romboutsia ilealis]|uniref:hypothetical protein n=1 Tax=Romboutsia ilealis TaxID=1115758 RepID=UPI0025A596C0|nr:hypothetical protein [Romboutsia ilealis]